MCFEVATVQALATGRLRQELRATAAQRDIQPVARLEFDQLARDVAAIAALWHQAVVFPVAVRTVRIHRRRCGVRQSRGGNQAGCKAGLLGDFEQRGQRMLWRAGEGITQFYIRRHAEHSGLGLGPGDHRGGGAGRVRGLLIDFVGFDQTEGWKGFERQGMVFTVAAGQLSGTDTRGRDRGDAHTVADKQNYVFGVNNWCTALHSRQTTAIFSVEWRLAINWDVDRIRRVQGFRAEPVSTGRGQSEGGIGSQKGELAVQDDFPFGERINIAMKDDILHRVFPRDRSGASLITVMLVDDHRLVRAGLRHVLEAHPDIVVVAEASSGEESLELARSHRPAIVLMDINMPGIGGLEATRRLLQRAPEIKVIAVTMHIDEPYPSRLLSIGAAGYLSKDAAADEVVAAIRRVSQGGHYVAASVAGNLAAALVKGGSGGSPFDRLSQREMQVMLMFTRGYSTQEISDRLCLSPKTVSTYRYRLFEKLGVNNDVELIRVAMRYGILDDVNTAVAAG